MSGYIKTLLVIIVTLLHSPGIVSARDVRQPGQPRYTIDEIITVLERLHSTRIFYEPEWFNDQLFGISLADLPLEQAVSYLAGNNNLTVMKVYDYIVLLPEVPVAGHQRDRDTLLLTIGNPAEYGRYNRVDFSGRILDGTTGESLPGAVIYSETTGTGSSTDPEGDFSINLPAGELLLRLSYVGYEDQYRRVNLLGPGEYDFYLFEETHRIDEVTIMARRAEENVTRTQMSVISMDSRILKELPGNLGEQDIIKSMTLLPGVQSVGEFGSGIHVRGGSNDQNLILIENVPLFNSSHLFGLVSVLNSDMISEMTLYKGGMPARYGERVSSVMDIRANTTDISKFRLTGGIGIINSKLHLETPLVKDKVYFSAGGRSSYSNWLLDRLPAEELLNSSAGFYDISTSLSISPDQHNNISLFAYQSDDKFSYAGDTEYDYGNILASIRWNRVMGEKLSLNVSGGLSMYDYNVSETVQSSPLEAYSLSSSVDYHSLKGSLLYFPDGNHIIESGINIIRYGINPGKLDPLGSASLLNAIEINREKGLEMSIFISDEFSITDRLSTEAGIRYTRYLYLGPSASFVYDENNPKRPEFITDTLVFGNNRTVAGYGGPEPRISIRYSLSDAGSVKASYTRNNQYINLISNTAVITPSDRWKLSDRHLQPLSSDNYALGFFRNFSNNMIETSVELYFRNIRNLTEYKEGAEILMSRNIETGLINAKGYSYGIEIYAGKNAGRLTGWLSYTLSSSRLRSEGHFPEDQINNNNYFPAGYDKPHELILNAGYNISRRWRIGATFNYNTGRPVTLPEMHFNHGDRELIYYSDRNKYRLPPYHRLDIYITRNESIKINKRRTGYWTLSLINVYGRKNPYSVFYERETQGPSIQSDSFNLYKLYIIGRPVPTLTYNFIF